MRRRLAVAAALDGALRSLPRALRPLAVSPERIRAAVVQTPALLARAWALPVARAYLPGVVPQSNASLCAPASLANALRSLGEPADSEAAVLTGSGVGQTGVCVPGVTLDGLARLARLHTARPVTVQRDLSLAAFREALRASNDPTRRTLVNFDRRVLFGGGPGHHSPLGGWLEAEDLAFVLDVNRDYGAWLIEPERLYAAVNTRDRGAPRGLIVIG